MSWSMRRWSFPQSSRPAGPSASGRAQRKRTEEGRLLDTYRYQQRGAGDRLRLGMALLHGDGARS